MEDLEQKVAELKQQSQSAKEIELLAIIEGLILNLKEEKRRSSVAIKLIDLLDVRIDVLEHRLELINGKFEMQMALKNG